MAKVNLGKMPPVSDELKKALAVEKHRFASGATSSQQVTRYDLCFFPFFTRVAGVFEYGATKHGDVNYQKCISVDNDGIRTLDVRFVRDRFNHGFKHLLNLKTGQEPERDNIGAVGWALSMLAWVESHGFNINRVLNPHLVNEVEFRLRLDGVLEILNDDGALIVEQNV